MNANATAPVRVMLVDDSSIVRRLLSAALSAYPEIEVVGTAANGVIALQRLPQLNPEAIILDVEMPEMDGITTLGHIRERYPRLPVIMFSTLTERGASTTFDALAVGASDYVLKPSTQTGETLEGIVGSSLVPKLMALTRSRFGLALQAAMALTTNEAPDTGKINVPAGSLAAPPQKPSLAAPFTRSQAPFAPRGPRTLSPSLARPSLPNAPLAPSAPTVAPTAVKIASQAPAPNTGLTRSLPAGRPSQPSPGAPTKGGAGTNLITEMMAPAIVARAPATLLQTVHRPSLAGQAAVRKPVQIIAIAASTGGPNALADVLPRLPGNLPVPIVIVQHMPPIFTRCLAERLAGRSELKVFESAGGERLKPGTVYIAPGNRHLELVRDAEGVSTVLSDGLPENSCRPSADVLFRSVVRAYGGGVLSIVLTGMGQDGLRGARDVQEAGGRVLVQSGPTCVIWGMPKAVEEAGLAEAVVPLPEMASAILQRVGLGLTPIRAPEGIR